MGKVKNNRQSKRNVRNNRKAKNSVRNSESVDVLPKLYIDFNEYPKWTYSYVGSKFTNALKDESDAAENFYFLVNELFGSVEKNIKQILSNNDSHSHRITGDKRELAVKISEKIHGFKLGDDVNIWQLSSDCNKGIRIVGVITTDKIYNFYPLFIDHNHLLFPDAKHNQTDYFSFQFCPQENWT
ncbi:hypothetical protein Lpp41_02914 [Lacticaseibacillus paracasei subsp. paracasei Lpp41]|uniref:Uncharacterized protein n=1 Tax=Lacticaseibacillus paracasei subsp. paracasei Lpp41 TaxID=1256208 RepID=A0A829HA52_LACPA|nr:hypothetical protein Lpp41_02914 [Lacticaseibacillus paracasei subsp. paracasei Lpp41]